MEDEEAGFSFSRDSTPNTSFSSSSTPTMQNMKNRTSKINRNSHDSSTIYFDKRIYWE